MRRISTALVVLSVALLWAGTALGGDDYEPGTPSTYLFDTGAPSGEPLERRPGRPPSRAGKSCRKTRSRTSFRAIWCS